MNTQIINDIMLAKGWNPPGASVPYNEGTIVLSKWWRKSASTRDGYEYSDPLPDTIDAAVGVIEGAGYRVYELTWSYADESYTAIAKCDKTHKEIAASAYDDDGRWKAAVRSVGDAMWQLALACVKAQRKEGE